MATAAQTKRRRLIQMAEGYLDLTTVFEDRWTLDQRHREKLADRAIECLNQVTRPLGHKPYILFLKGQAHRTAGRFREAIDLFQQSSKLDPDNLHNYLAIAWCFKRTGQLAKAIDSLKLALKVDSSYAIAHYNLACYWALTNNVELAVYHLATALDLNGDFRNLVATESDFDSIRDSDSFQALTSVNV